MTAQDLSESVVVSVIETVIDGKTKEPFLLRKIGLQEGQEFDSYDDLVDFLDEATQDMINSRVFELFEYEIEPLSEADGDNRYIVIIKADDSFTFYPIPYPKYNSNTGFQLGLQVYYYNAFGSLIDFALYTSFDLNKNQATGSWDITYWDFTPTLEGINLWGQDFSFEIGHEYKTYKKLGAYNGEENVLLQIYSLHNTSVSLGTKLYLPMDFYYTARPSLGVYYGLEEAETDQYGNPLPFYDPLNKPDYDVLDFSWHHAVGYDGLDWIGNFRDGFTAELANRLTLSSDLNENNPVNFSTELSAELKYFWRINRYFNLSTMALGLVSFRKEMTSLGENLRGVRDDLLYGDKAVFWSIDMNIAVINWEGVGEAQFSPFFSLGYVRNDYSDEPALADRDMFSYSAGADFLLYIDKLSAFKARVSFAVDLGQFDWSDSAKYEMDMTTSLSY